MFTVVLDACVIIPATLNDTMLRIAEAGGYGVRWSEEILGEVRHNMLRLGVPEDAADRRLDAMRQAFPFAEVTGYEGLVPVMANDPKDRHVLAATLRSQAHTIVTFNLKDFPMDSVEPWDVEVVHPDQFLLSQLDLEPYRVLTALHQQIGANRRPPRSVDELVAALRRCGVPGFADELRRHL